MRPASQLFVEDKCTQTLEPAPKHNEAVISADTDPGEMNTIFIAKLREARHETVLE